MLFSSMRGIPAHFPFTENSTIIILLQSTAVEPRSASSLLLGMLHKETSIIRICRYWKRQWAFMAFQHVVGSHFINNNL